MPYKCHLNCVPQEAFRHRKLCGSRLGPDLTSSLPQDPTESQMNCYFLMMLASLQPWCFFTFFSPNTPPVVYPAPPSCSFSCLEAVQASPLLWSPSWLPSFKPFQIAESSTFSPRPTRGTRHSSGLFGHCSHWFIWLSSPHFSSGMSLQPLCLAY